MDISKLAKPEVADPVTEVTVGTQNKFSEALINASNMVIKKLLSKIDYSYLKKFFPEIALEDPIFLKDVHAQLLSQLEKNFIEDLDKFFIEQNVHRKLYELHLLIKSNKTDEEKSWRPSGDPNEDIRDHRCKSKLKHLKSLEAILLNLEGKNDQLKQTLIENHEEILLIKERVFDIDGQNQAKLKTLTENQLSRLEELLPLSDELLPLSD